jgi:hypothetical protein
MSYGEYDESPFITFTTLTYNHTDLMLDNITLQANKVLKNSTPTIFLGCGT